MAGGFNRVDFEAVDTSEIFNLESQVCRQTFNDVFPSLQVSKKFAGVARRTKAVPRDGRGLLRPAERHLPHCRSGGGISLNLSRTNCKLA